MHGLMALDLDKVTPVSTTLLLADGLRPKLRRQATCAVAGERFVCLGPCHAAAAARLHTFWKAVCNLQDQMQHVKRLAATGSKPVALYMTHHHPCCLEFNPSMWVPGAATTS